MSAIQADQRLTPMMRQYLDAKAEHPDAILMFRMGDFFEMFFEDAKTAAKELDIVLTTRDKDRPEGGIPMAGVPHHAVNSYIARLIERGYTVAMCDQVEDPKKAKGLVRREITRLVTPGTVSDLEALDPMCASYIAAIESGEGEHCVIALLDLLAGELLVTHCPRASLGDELRRMGAREVLVSEAANNALGSALNGALGLPLRVLHDALNALEARELLTRRLGTSHIEGIEGEDGAEHLALARLIVFAESTQRRRLEHLMQPRLYRLTDNLVLDEATRRNLELTHTQIENRRHGSLLWHIDRCRTAIGSRLLNHWLLFPLCQREPIEQRLDAVSTLKDARPARARIRELLEGVRDVERLLGRIAVGRAVPRDLGAVRASLERLPELQALVKELQCWLGRRWEALDTVADVRGLLSKALVDDPPLSCLEGGIFRRGYRGDLDELISLSTEGHGFLTDLERRERSRTGISNLRVRYNKVFGYFIEVTKTNLGQVPPDYVRKQTLVNAERFITDELKHYEDRVLGADEKRKAREEQLFAELVQDVGRHAARLRAISRLLAETDALCSLAEVADEGRYTRPELTHEPILDLRDCRHPVLERLMPGGERFVPNDIHIHADGAQLIIVTGPNMAGKSTVMRQAALVTILAHIGSFVPAKAANVGLCDRVFTRVGAADNLGRGQSTFMVEMVETATILEQASRASLVLLDEIGRGTSTFDGVSIAWAVAEHLHDQIGCRAMFATHYHELTDLALERPRIKNASIAVKEHEGRVVFLRRLVEGAANRSYGIQVARLAGLPEHVLARARQILGNLEAGELDERGMPAIASSRALETGQLALFQTSARGPTEVEKALAALDPLNMTPLQALAELDRLKKLTADKENEGRPLDPADTRN